MGSLGEALFPWEKTYIGRNNAIKVLHNSFGDRGGVGTKYCRRHKITLHQFRHTFAMHRLEKEISLEVLKTLWVTLLSPKLNYMHVPYHKTNLGRLYFRQLLFKAFLIPLHITSIRISSAWVKVVIFVIFSSIQNIAMQRVQLLAIQSIGYFLVLFLFSSQLK